MSDRSQAVGSRRPDIEGDGDGGKSSSPGNLSGSHLLRSLVTRVMRASYQLLRAVPGTVPLRRQLRDAAWLRDADSVVISYPKSGRTFVRAMLSRLYQRKFDIDERHLLEFSTLRHARPGVPRVLFTHAGKAMGRPGEIGIARSDYGNRKLILIARHPADTAVSRFYHFRHRSRDRARLRLGRQPLEKFVCGKDGFPAVVAYLNFFAAIPGVVILRYEDFIADPGRALERLAAAIGLNVDREDIADAVEFGRLANLREREREGYFKSVRLRPMRKGDEKTGKVRLGRAGGYRAELSPEAVEWIDTYVQDKLDPRLGYQPG